MRETGVVVEVNENKATVLFKNGEGCEGCEFSNFCHPGKEGRKIICINDKGANVGDVVEIDISRKNAALAVVLNFILPLIFLVVGVLLGKKLWGTDLAGFLLGIGLMALYFLIFVFVDKRIVKSGTLLPKIIKIKESYNSKNVDSIQT
ncbi:SoxR reducing system RseC family protein [candidate division WOR-3 bacterium]|nr:SoxR reducing system RseC family protein [candidate division WOR-3 bacterium]